MTYKAGDMTVNSGTFTNSDKHLITAADDGNVRLFDVQSGECLYTFFNHRSENVKCVAAMNSTGSMVIAANTNNMLYILAP